MMLQRCLPKHDGRSDLFAASAWFCDGRIATFRGAAAFGRYRGIADIEEAVPIKLGLWVRALATFRRKIGALGRVVKGAQQRKTRRERPAGVLQSLMVRAGGFTGQPAFPLRGRC